MRAEVTWKKELEIGVPAVDDQHRELFRRFNLLLNACHDGYGREEVGKLIGFLHDYVEVHFFDEEELMRERAYPEYESHRREHREFAGRLEGLDGEGSLVLLIQMNTMLIEWLNGHILKSDRKIGEFLKNNA